MQKIPIDTLVKTDWHNEHDDAVLLKVAKAPAHCPEYLLEAEERGEKYWLVFSEPMDEWDDGILVENVPSGWYNRDRIEVVPVNIVESFEELLATYGVD